jgi:DNA-binding MurR/RpiR family transcriptional regulator
LVDEYIELVALRNTYAKALGYKNFYYFKVQLEERMNADTIFNIFDRFYEKTKSCLEKIRNVEKQKP